MLFPSIKDLLQNSAIATLIGAILTFAGSLIGIWLKDRNFDQRQLQYLDRATKYLGFWEQHRKLQQVIGSDTSGEALFLQQRLNAASDFIKTSVFMSQPRSRPLQVQPSSWLRRWLLLYKPVRLWAWWPRLYFYYCIIVALFVPFPILAGTTGEAWIVRIAIAMGISVAALVIALPFRVISRLIEGPRPFSVLELLFAKRPRSTALSTKS